MEDTRKTAETAVGTAKDAVTALQAADGAWGLANAKREASVAAAVAKETADNISGLLDAMDTASADERAKAALYAAADEAFNAGTRRATAAAAAVVTTTAELARLSTAKDAAQSAVDAVRAQSTKEILWREWLYCELGGTVAGDATANWWTFITSDTAISGAGAAPVFCTVPALNAETDASGAALSARGAIRYFTTRTVPASGAVDGKDATEEVFTNANLASRPNYLSAESLDGGEKYTATLLKTEADTALSTAADRSGEAGGSAMGSTARTRAGVVAWATGNYRAANWMKQQKTVEKSFYTNVKNLRLAAKALVTANNNASTTDYTNATTGYGIATGCTGSETACQSRAKWLAAKLAARDSTSSGSGFNMPGTRAVTSGTGNEHLTTWTIDASSLDTFTTNNGTAGATFLWWSAARGLTAALDAWYTAWGSSATTTTMNSADASGAIENQIYASASNPVSCDTTTGWTANAAANVGACKLACVAYTYGKIVKDWSYTPSGGTAVDYSASLAPAFDATGGYCGAYSWDDDGATDQKCKLKYDAEDAVKLDTTTVANDRCFNMNNAAGNDPKSSSAWNTLHGNTKTAWEAVTATLHTNLVGATDAQAVLEQAWLGAYYDSAYWTKVEAELEDTGELAAVYTAAATAIDATGVSETQFTSLTAATVADTTAETFLSTATTTLTNL